MRSHSSVCCYPVVLKFKVLNVLCIPNTMPRNALSMKNKLELIECFEKEKLSVKQLQERFNCGKTQVYEAIRKKEEIKKDLEKGLSLRSKRKATSCENEELNKLVWEWFVQARSKNIPLSGPIIQEKAREFAVALGKPDFKASNGWLESFKSRHYVVWNGVSNQSSEPNNVDMTSVEWKVILQGRIKDYQPCDVYNGDETGIFFRALPSNYSSCPKDGNCGGGKHSKERLTLFVCGNMSGELVTPMVIGRSAQPRCFKNLDIRKLPVTWKSNKNAWNTTSIMEEWLKSFNSDMKRKGRKVILFLDGAACHPKIRLSNVELAWLQGNTSSVNQPMNQGVIRSLKALYRKHLVRSLLCAGDSKTALSNVSREITLLDAINWINLAVREIKPATVISGFAKAGFLLKEDSDNESTCGINELQELMGISASAEEFVNFDNDLPTCSESETLWENAVSGRDCESDEDVNASANGDRSITSYKEMLINLKDLVDSSSLKGNADLFNILNEAIVNVENCIIRENRMNP